MSVVVASVSGCTRRGRGSDRQDGRSPGILTFCEQTACALSLLKSRRLLLPSVAFPIAVVLLLVTIPSLTPTLAAPLSLTRLVAVYLWRLHFRLCTQSRSGIAIATKWAESYRLSPESVASAIVRFARNMPLAFGPSCSRSRRLPVANRLLRVSSLWVTGMLPAGSISTAPLGTNVANPASVHYSVEGVARVMTRTKEPDTNYFEVSVDGSRWIVSYRPSRTQLVRDLHAKSAGRPLQAETYTQSSDGTNVYFLHTHVPAVTNTNTVVASGWHGVGSVPIMGDRLMLSLWYAYASSVYLDSIQKTGIVQILPLHATVLDDPDIPRLARGVVERIDGGPRLPVAMLLTNKSGVPALHPHIMHLVASALTNSRGVHVPMQVDVDYGVYLHDTGQLFSSNHIEILATAIRQTGNVAHVVPVLPGTTRVVDLTYYSNLPPFTITLTTNRWPTMAAIDLLYRQFHPRPGRFGTLITVALLVLAGAFPVLIVMWRRRSSKQ